MSRFDMKKIVRLFPLLLFLVLIYGTTIWCIAKDDTEKSDTENRYLAQMPDFSAKTLFDGTFGQKYETYLSDQFILRDQFIGLKSQTEVVMGKSDLGSVYLAKDDYLIRKYNEESFDFSLVDTNVAAVGKFFHTYVDKLGKDHVKMLIVPTAAMVLTNKLPEFAAPYDEDQLITKLKKTLPEDTLIDATIPLQVHRDQYIYYMTDHHWTSLGAWYGYEAWAEATGNQVIPLDQYGSEVFTHDFLGTNHSSVCYAKKADTIILYKYKKDVKYQVLYDQLWSSKEEKKPTDTLYETSHLNDKDKYEVFLDGNHAIVDIKTSVKNGKKLLLVKDSYSHCMIPYLANQFEQITVIDTRYYNLSIDTLDVAKNYTDILLLRNTVQFMQDDSVFKLAIQ